MVKQGTRHVQQVEIARQDEERFYSRIMVVESRCHVADFSFTNVIFDDKMQISNTHVSL
jgi:hypothetical protein